MEPTKELIDALFRERVLRARRMSPEEKILVGPRLFEWACRIARDGIRDQHPDATDEQVEEILLQRLALGRRLRNAQ
jgi:Rv0078B-related antitoxin